VSERTLTTADGVRIWLSDTEPRTARAGALPMVFLHGFSGSSSATVHLAAHVASVGRRFVAPDLRGHGMSGKPAADGAYALERFVSDVADVADGCEIGRFHLVGHCMGGMIAAAFAAAHPERLESLALVGTSLHPGAERPVFARMSAAVQRPVMPLARRVFPAGTDAPAHVDYSRFRNMGDMYWRRMLADWRALTAQTGEAITRTIRSIDLLEAAAAIATPALVAHGARDSIFPLAAARRTHAAIPGSTLTILPDDNHVTLVLDPGSILFDQITGFAAQAEVI
jgi:pimeloyl-ACP methyl ester carboxylesterase